MLKKFFGRKKPGNPSSRRTYSEAEHGIYQEDISRSALQIIDRLEEAGFEAYLVGGGVRDLLIGGHPKDFDIATDATPEQVKRLFRSARIIGRRFRIVHVRLGRDMVEVTTFRAQHSSGDEEDGRAGETGMLLRDNVYGDIHSDAVRRDFTMNALYYSPSDSVVTDFTTGMEDIKARLVRMIGDPKTRYQEDPVRMLRAVRLAAKLNFDIEPKTAEPILELGNLLGHVPAARLFDECLKLFMNGHAEATYLALRRYRLFGVLFPGVDDLLGTDPIAERLVHQATINTDARVNADKRVTPAFIFAVILWPAVVREQERLEAEGMPPLPALNLAAQDIITAQVRRISIPRRFTTTMREIWDLQPRLPRRRGTQAFRLVTHPRFRAAYDFLLLREQAGEDHQGLGAWWTAFQEADEGERKTMVAGLQDEEGKPARKRRSRRRTPPRPPRPDSH